MRTSNMPTKLVLAAAVAGLALAVAPHAVAAPGDQVVYTITSDGALSSVTYRDASNNPQQVTNVTAPWSISFTSQAPAANYAVTARSTGSQVSCTITVNGQIVDRDSDNDGVADVDCHESWDDD